MQSAFFCQQMGMPIDIYVPGESQFLMYFEHGVVTVDLDRSYLRSPDSARDHAREIVEGLEIRHSFFEPTRFTAGLPDLRSDYAFMSCPRSISDLSTKIGLGHIGSRVRAIVKQAPFPVLMPAASFKQWNRIVCFFGGSANSLIALRCAREISRRSKARLTIFTQVEGGRDTYEHQLDQEGLAEDLGEGRDRVALLRRQRSQRRSLRGAFRCVGRGRRTRSRRREGPRVRKQARADPIRAPQPDGDRGTERGLLAGSGRYAPKTSAPESDLASRFTPPGLARSPLVPPRVGFTGSLRPLSFSRGVPILSTS